MKDRFEAAPTFLEFLEEVDPRWGLWRQVYERARVPDEILERARAVPGRWHLLALAEDWCGDGMSTLPFVARLVEAVPSLALKILSRDENLDLMDAHLSDGKRAIPVVIALDDDFREVGWWGSRPQALEDLFQAELKDLPKEERFARLRAWYARDRGRSALAELLELIPS